jgi:hypothetical protein
MPNTERKFNDYGISTLADLDRPSHPDYSGRTFPPGGGDRCTCGGVRHWHAKPPSGCDDCECSEFTAAPLEPTEVEVRERVAREIEAYLASSDGPGLDSNAANAYREAARIARGGDAGDPFGAVADRRGTVFQRLDDAPPGPNVGPRVPGHRPVA